MKLNFWLLEDLIDMVFVQWSSGPIQFELDGQTGLVEGVFLGESAIFFSISSRPDRTSSVIQWSGPIQLSFFF